MEEQTKRMALLSVAALVVVALVFGAIYYFSSQKSSEPAPVAEISQNVAPIVIAPENDAPIQKLAAPVSDSKEARLKRFCIDFIARFGTYSTDGNSMNLVQIMPLLSGDLKVWAEGRIANKSLTEKFSGVVTKALAAKIISQNADAAVVEISTQRMYTENNQQRVVYEDATVSLVNGGSWRVVAVSWKARAE